MPHSVEVTFLCFTGIPGIAAAAIIGLCCLLAVVVFVDIERADRRRTERERSVARNVLFGLGCTAFMGVALLIVLTATVLGSFLLDKHEVADRSGTTVEPLIPVFGGYASPGAEGGFQITVKRGAELVPLNVPRLQVTSGDPELTTRIECSPRDVGLVWLDGTTFTCKETVTAAVPR